MNYEKLVKEIIDLGIPEKEARIYCALLQKRELTALEIQEIAHVPRTKVYEFTRRMVVKNMCIEKLIGTRKKYQAVEPEKFLRSLIQNQETEIDEKRRNARELEKAITPLYRRGRKPAEPSESIEIIRDLGSIYERYLSFIRKAEREYIGLVKPPFVHQGDDKRVHELDATLFARIKKGVNVRMVYEIPPDDKRSWTYTYIRQCVKNGEQARVIENLPMKVYILDQRYILMMLVNSPTDISPVTMFVVDHPPLAFLGVALFDALWREAKDYRILKYPPPK